MSAALATRRAHLLSERAQVDANGGGAIWLLSGTMTAEPEDAPAGPPLAIVVLPVPSFSLHATLASMSLVATGNAALSGLVTWARFVDGAGAAVRDLPAGPPGSGAPVIVDNGAVAPTAQVYTGGEINVSATFTY